MEEALAVVTDLRTEWRRAVKDIDQQIRHLDAAHQIHILRNDSGEAVRRWRMTLVAWQDEAMEMLRDYRAG